MFGTGRLSLETRGKAFPSSVLTKQIKVGYQTSKFLNIGQSSILKSRQYQISRYHIVHQLIPHIVFLISLLPDIIKKRFQHEHAEFQRSALGQSTAGNDVVATIFVSLFFFLFPPRFFPPSLPSLIEGVLGSKNLLSESCLECPET